MDQVDCSLCHQSVKLAQYISHLTNVHGSSKDVDLCCPSDVCGGKQYTTIAGLRSHWYRNHHVMKVEHNKPQPAHEEAQNLDCEESENHLFGASDSFNLVDRNDFGNGSEFGDQEFMENECVNEIGFDVSAQELSENIADESESLVDCSGPEDLLVEDSVSESDEDGGVEGHSHQFPSPQSNVLIKEAPSEDLPFLKSEAGKFVLLVKTTFGVTESALDRILNATTDLLKSVLLSFVGETCELYKESVTLNPDQLKKKALEASAVLSDFEKKSKRNSLLSKQFHKLPVSKKVVGVFGKRKGVGGKRRTVIAKDTVMYIPISKSLFALSRHKDFSALLRSENVSTDPNLIDSHLKSECFQRNVYFANHPNAFRIILYFDELEICNVLGAMAGKHKLGCVYYVLDNIPLKYRTHLDMIQLAALFNSNFVKKYANGMDAVLKPVVDELKKLEQGIQISDGSVMHGSLIAIIGDNLGSHQVGGFKEGFTAHRPCRTCLVTYEDLKTMVKEDPSLLRTKDNYNQQVAQVVKPGDAKSVEFGINRNPIVNSLENYHVIDGLPPDGHHDILQGSLQVTLKNLLAFLVRQNHIKLQELNDLMANGFDYGYSDIKPSEIKSDHLLPDGNLRQSAMQMWHLAVLLPLFIGKHVPENCPQWENFIQLLEICRIIFSHTISVAMLDLLSSLITQYLTSYLECYEGSLIPKQHHLLHYILLIKKFGPPVFFWAMRMEAKHKIFKKLVSVLGNYKNPPWTLANIHEWRMALYRSGSLVPENKCGPTQCHPVNILPYAGLIRGAESIKLTRWAYYNGLLLKSGGVCFVVLGRDDSFYPTFALVQDLVVWPEYRIVCKKVETQLYNTHYSAYQVAVSDEFLIIQPANLKGHTVFHSHAIDGELLIPMRYSIDGSTIRDKLGILRGSCTLCDCPDFEPPKSGPFCDYCAHTAPNHRSLGIPADLSLNQGQNCSTFSSSSAAAASSSSIAVEQNPSETPCDVNICSISRPWIVNIPHASDLTNQPFQPLDVEFVPASQASSSGSSSALLPEDEALGDDGADTTLLEALKAGTVSNEQELLLIRDVAKHLHKKKKDKPKYLHKAARKMHKKWKCVGSSQDKDQGGLHYQLRRRMEKLRRKQRRYREKGNKENVAPRPEIVNDLLEVPIDDMNHQQRCEKLKELSEAGNGSKPLIDALMTATREARKLECQVRTSSVILESYPCLREKDYLISELAALTQVPYASMQKNYDDNFQKLIDLANKEMAMSIPDTATDDQKGILFLHGMHNLFKKQKHSVLQIFPENTTVEKTKPKGRVVGKRAPPQLLTIGDILTPPVTFHAFLDGEIMFCSDDPKEAIFLLLSIYYVFSIKWCPKTRLQLLLLTGAFVSLDIVRREVNSNTELKSVFKKLGFIL